ncbi:MAG: SpoIIE family protein phosphatase [bacterium]|nr:SpoIIE family protein phosphatase [bacterium]
MIAIGKRTLFVLVTLALLIPGIGLYAVEPVQLDPDTTDYPLASHLEVLEDREQALTINDAASSYFTSSYQFYNQDTYSFGFTSSVYWIRFAIKNPTAKDIEWYLEIDNPNLDRIDLYVRDAAGKLSGERVAGDKLDFGKREVEYRNFIFKLKEKNAEEHTCYVRIQTSGAMNFSLKMSSPRAFYKNMNLEYAILGIYYGAMLIMVIYHLFMFFTLRISSYLYYILFCFSFLMFQLANDGLAFQYIWPRSVTLANTSVVFFILSTVIFAIQFSRSFMNTKVTIPRIDLIAIAIMLICLVCLPFSIIFEHLFVLRLSVLAIVLTAILLVVGSFIVAKNGYRPARFYVLAWTIFWIGTVSYSLYVFSILPGNIFIRLSQQASSLISVILISFGMAENINFMKGKLESLNLNLENSIEERTGELNKTLKKMERNNKEIVQELELAANIQEGILPEMPYYHEGVRIDAFYRSMGKVGGDFYDIFLMKGGYIGVLIADVSGHGMPAAFITAMAKISFSDAIQSHLFPRDIFIQVNNELIKTIKTDDFVTAFFVVISPSFEVFYCNASHQMALVLRKNDNTIDHWDTNGLFMGYLPIANSMYEDGQDVLNYGDRMFLYTDGISDCKNKKEETFTIERLSELLLETANLPIKEAKEKIISEWEEFARGTEQSDDVSFVLIEIDPAYQKLVTHREQGFKYLAKKQFKEAIAELNEALKVESADKISHLYIGECYLQDGNYLKAVEHLSEHLLYNEIDANVWGHLAEAYFNLKNYTMADRTAQKAAQLRNNFVDALEISGLSLMKLGKIKDAVQLWKKILVINPAHERAKKELNRIKEAKRVKKENNEAKG